MLQKTNAGLEEDEEPAGEVLECDRVSLITRCREHSPSLWLHYPHVELLVLFFSFLGAVALQVSAIRANECPEIVITATAAPVSLSRHGRWNALQLTYVVCFLGRVLSLACWWRSLRKG